MDVSVAVRMTAKVKAAIAAIVYDEPSGRWVSRAEVAEIDFTAFTRLASERTSGRLVVRRIPDLNPHAGDGQGTLFDTWRFHAFFTTTDPAMLDTVAADKVHRGHAIIEQSMPI